MTLNCTPFVRQYDILDNKWGAVQCLYGVHREVLGSSLSYSGRAGDPGHHCHCQNDFDRCFRHALQSGRMESRWPIKVDIPAHPKEKQLVKAVKQAVHFLETQGLTVLDSA